MDKNKKLILISNILVIITFIFSYFNGDFTSSDELQNKAMIISLIISIIGIIYEFVLIFNKKIDLNNHKSGILGWSIYFLLVNIISGILGLVANSKLDGSKKKKRELPKIELKEYTNKYICLVAFIVCLSILMFGDKFINSTLTMVLAYIFIFITMLLVFRKQLIHDFKIFKDYFKEYSSLVFKTWLKALVAVLIFGIIIQIVTETQQSNNQQALQDSFNSMPIFISLLSIIYAPIAEELMFRGVFRKFIKNDKLFIIISGVLFGLLHVIDDSKTLAEFSYIIVYSALGMYLAGLYAKTNNLCTNIFMHALQNTLSVIGMILLTLL